MTRYIIELREIDRSQVALAGGKGANLGELSRIGGVHVPPGFCVTTDAWRAVVAQLPADADGARALGSVPIPDDIRSQVEVAVDRLGPARAFAVRSSATAEDSADASFAGQHDSYLGVSGDDVLEHVRRCWASLFSERAVAYRRRNGIADDRVQMAVVVQQMVSPRASGVLFTADPTTGHRKVSVIEATLGLGEALVSGRVNPDGFTVRGGRILEAAQRQPGPTLTEAQAVRLAELGRRIEAHFGTPQDIEWCLADDSFQVVQSRPITTLFPVPETSDGENHVYVSVGHQQMMTDALKPLGLSFWLMTTPRPMAVAGGRLFVDVTRELASRSTRASLIGLLGKSDPLIGDALQIVVDRGDFIETVADDKPLWAPPGSGSARLETDPALVTELVEQGQASIAALRRDIATKSGPALFDFIEAHMRETRSQSDPRVLQVVMAGMEATWWLNDKVQAWLGEKNAADALAQSAPNNVTSEMGLALLDVADAIRVYPGVVTFLERSANDDLMNDLSRLEGGVEARDAIAGWLEKYGMRGTGEIDITRPRWSEQPSMLVPAILANIRNFASGEARRRFDQGLEEARRKEQELLQRIRGLPDGEEKAEETKRMIDRLRTFVGFREYPKYVMVSRYFAYKQAMLAEAGRLVKAGVLESADDVFYLTFEEFRDVSRTHRANQELIRRRAAEFESYRALRPPRVFTSDGEAVAGSYKRSDFPNGALVGLPVSAGLVEGRARVVLDMAKADLEPGDILVTAYTDPSWTPLFVAIRGLVTEVGGLMTHGAVIAREYGLPAVVGVENATRIIRDGQRIRVHGTEGYIELLA
jgi:pyruvate,water dikinase